MGVPLSCFADLSEKQAPKALVRVLGKKMSFETLVNKIKAIEGGTYQLEEGETEEDLLLFLEEVACLGTLPASELREKVFIDAQDMQNRLREEMLELEHQLEAPPPIQTKRTLVCTTISEPSSLFWRCVKNPIGTCFKATKRVAKKVLGVQSQPVEGQNLVTLTSGHLFKKGKDYVLKKTKKALKKAKNFVVKYKKEILIGAAVILAIAILVIAAANLPGTAMAATEGGGAAAAGVLASILQKDNSDAETANEKFAEAILSDKSEIPARIQDVREQFYTNLDSNNIDNKAIGYLQEQAALAAHETLEDMKANLNTPPKVQAAIQSLKNENSYKPDLVAFEPNTPQPHEQIDSAFGTNYAENYSDEIFFKSKGMEDYKFDDRSDYEMITADDRGEGYVTQQVFAPVLLPAAEAAASAAAAGLLSNNTNQPEGISSSESEMQLRMLFPAYGIYKAAMEDARPLAPDEKLVQMGLIQVPVKVDPMSANSSNSREVSSEAKPEFKGEYFEGFPDRPLPRDPRTDDPKSELDVPNTQLGTKGGSKGKYRQAREFDADGNEIRRIDFTDHGRPQNHTNPHQHRPQKNTTGGTPKGGPPEPLPEIQD